MTSLHDENYKEYSQISFLHNEPKATMLDEITIIIKNIKNLVNNSFITEYTSEGGYKKRKIEYKDIALLSRNANFLINFKKEAERAGIPVISEGRSFIYETQAAVLILAWFRYLLDSRHKAARLAINQFENLVQANFSKTTLKEKAAPLKKYIKYPVSLAYAILQMYQLENTASEAIIQDLKSIWNSSLMTLGDFALMLEDFINNPDGVNLDNQATHNSVKIQTMHASKGLEYNVVFVANINRQIFPSFKSKYDRFIYNDTVGFRGKKQFIKEHNIICDNWKTALVLGCLDSDYQEERQLLYVAITRARFKLFFSAYRPSSFYNELLKNIEDEAIVFSKDGKDRENTSTSSAKSTLQNNTFDKVKECNSRFLRLPIASLRLPTGSLRPQDDGFSKRGAALGNKIHFQLERYCLTGEVEPQEELIEKDYMNAIKFLKQQDDLIKIDTEVECQLALPSGIIVYGRIDVLLIKNKCIDIIDWKSSQADEPNYQIQLSFYYHAVVKSQEKEVKAFVFKTFDGNLEQIDCLSIEELDNLTQKFVKSSQYLTLDN